MTAHLVARPVPIVGESPAGVLMRAVEKNGYPNLQALVWAYWQKQGGKGWATAAIADPGRYREIIEALGIQYSSDVVPAFSRIGPTSESDRLFEGMVIPERLFREDGRFYCPECLREKAYWRKSWALRPVSVCSKHGKYLFRDCPDCGAHLHPWRGKLAKCECGADLSAAKGIPADPAALDWWTYCHKQPGNQSQIIDATFLAIEAIDGGDNLPQVDYRRLSIVHDWIVNGVVNSHLQELIKQRSGTIHPRIQLLPLLGSGHAELKNLAEAILESWPPCRPVEIPATGEVMQTRKAELALGVSCFQFKKFVKLGLVDFAGGRAAKLGQVSLDAINRILYSLQTSTVSPLGCEGRQQTTSLAGMVEGVMTGTRTAAGYDVVKGLTSLQLLVESPPEAKTDEAEDWIDVIQISSLLGTYPDAVRFLVKKGHLPARDRDLQGRKKLIANRPAVEKFNQRFVFAGVLAKEFQMNPTNLAEKLMATGVNPVSGPRVDGALVYLFSRDEIKEVDFIKLQTLKNYETLAGRKPKPTEGGSGSKSSKTENSGAISASQAAVRLGIKPQKIRFLIRKGVLKEVELRQRAVYVTTRSVERLRKNLRRKDMVSVEDAAAQFNLAPKTFESLWVKRGAIKVHDWGYWRRISTRDLESLRSKVEGRVTASEAGRMMSIHRSHLPNMERRGEVKSVLVGKKLGVRLYEREELVKK